MKTLKTITLSFITILFILACVPSWSSSVSVSYGFRILTDSSADFYSPENLMLKSGETVQMKFYAYSEMFVYLVLEGSANTVQMMYPADKVEPRVNVLKKKTDQLIPTNGGFRLDDAQGTERVHVILSAKKIPQLEQLIAANTTGGAPLEQALTVLKSLQPKGFALSKEIEPSYTTVTISGVESEDVVMFPIELTHKK